MTTLQITPNWKNKTAKFKGTIAAGEHVAVSIADEDGYIADTTNLRLRVVCPMNGKTLAQFPMPEPADEETDGEDEVLPSAEAPADGEVEWISGDGQVSCIIDLNTDRMLMAVPPAANVPLLFVLDAYKGTETDSETGEITDPGEFTLYFKDMCEVTHWPRRTGEEEPTRLDDYKDIIADFREDIYGEGGFKDRVENAERAAIAAEDSARLAAERAGNSESGAEAAMSAAQASAATARSWATGGGETGDPGEENNAKYYAQQAGASATSAGNSATSAGNSATSASGSATAAEKWATGGTGGTPSATNNAKYYAEQAEATLEDKADQTDLEAEVARATEAEEALDDAIEAEETRATGVEDGLRTDVDSALDKLLTLIGSVSGDDTKSVRTIGAEEVAKIVAGASTSYDTLKEIADWIQNDTTGAARMANDIAGLKIDKVDKEPGKTLTSNDFTTAYKDKLSGVEFGAKDNVVEAASVSAFPQPGVTGKIYVAKDENKTYRWDGSSYVEISASLALGETSSTAYRGDKGKTAYNHATDSNRLTTAKESGLYKIATTAEGHVKSATAVTKLDITNLGIPAQDTTYGVAMPSTSGAGGANGLMSAADKERLNGIETGAKDNIVEAESADDFPSSGETGKIYIAQDEDKIYRWDGETYVQIGGGGGGPVSGDYLLRIDPTNGDVVYDTP